MAGHHVPRARTPLVITEPPGRKEFTDIRLLLKAGWAQYQKETATGKGTPSENQIRAIIETLRTKKDWPIAVLICKILDGHVFPNSAKLHVWEGVHRALPTQAWHITVTIEGIPSMSFRKLHIDVDDQWVITGFSDNTSEYEKYAEQVG